MIVLDTNVLSELMRPSPNPAVMRWVGRQPRRRLCTTCINEAEMLVGVALMPESRRRAQLIHDVDRMFADDLAGRVLPFVSAASAQYASIVLARRRSGRPVSEMDALIAAVTLAAGAEIATRDTAGFAHIAGLRIIDPWTQGA